MVMHLKTSFQCRAAFKNVLVHLIEAILQSEQPQTALLRLMPLIESVMRRTVYLVMLIESKGALQRLVKWRQ